MKKRTVVGDAEVSKKAMQRSIVSDAQSPELKKMSQDLPHLEVSDTSGNH